MSTETAQLIIAGGFAIGVAVWLLSLKFVGNWKSQPAVIAKSARLMTGATDDVMRAFLVFATSQPMARVRDKTVDGAVVELQHATLTVRFKNDFGATGVNVSANLSKGRNRFILALSILQNLIAPIVLLAVPAILWFLVAPSDNPAIRWQAIQIIQIGHILWPPFLIGSLAKKQRQAAERFIDNMLTILDTVK